MSLDCASPLLHMHTGHNATSFQQVPEIGVDHRRTVVDRRALGCAQERPYPFLSGFQTVLESHTLMW